MAEEVNDMQTTASIVPPLDPHSAIAQPPPDDICVRLSARDAKQVLDDISNPPKPNDAALRAAKRFEQKYG